MQKISNVREIVKCEGHGQDKARAPSLSGALGGTKSRSGLSHPVRSAWKIEERRKITEKPENKADAKK